MGKSSNFYVPAKVTNSYVYHTVLTGLHVTCSKGIG